MKVVNPAVHADGLAGLTVKHRRLFHMNALNNGVEFTESSGLQLAGGLLLEFILVVLGDIPNMANPVVVGSTLLSVERRFDAAAPVVAANDDVLDAQRVDCEVDDGDCIEVRVNDEIRDVTVNKNLARGKAHDLIGRDAAVRTSDP